MTVLEVKAAVGHNRHDKFQGLVAKAQCQPPLKVAVAHPCDQVSLESVAEAARLKLIEPILVGPENADLRGCRGARHRHREIRNCCAEFSEDWPRKPSRSSAKDAPRLS